jgi:hypothetical protein
MGRQNGEGEWGVKRGRECGTFPGEEGSSGRRQLAREVAAAAPGGGGRRKKKAGSLTGWAHLSVSGGGGAGWAGRERGDGPVAWAGR